MSFSEHGSPMTMKSPRVPPHEPAPDNADPVKGYGWHLFIGLMLLFFGLSVWSSVTAPSPVPSVDYSEFYAWAKRGDVKSVEFAGQSLRGTLERAHKIGNQETDSFSTVLPSDDPALLPLLREQGATIRVSNQAPSAVVEILAGLLPWVLMIGVWVWLSRRTQRMFSGGSGPLGSILKTKSRKFDKETAVQVTFDDVAGLKPRSVICRRSCNF